MKKYVNGELVDMSAGEVADFEASRAVDLPAMKDMLKARVDAAAESERLKYITPGAGQALTYAQKADQARAYLEAVSPVDEDYPLLSAEIGVTGATAAEVANVIRASFTAWQQIGSQIEATRLRAKKAIEGASDAESAIEAASNLTWLS
ncbi:hypothetical protein B5K05_00480 [Rhizobium phaseoli]|uniref:hypothetical protein n=1 Tax=Rhizobium phaseoli TaxID=396 RepID=UPI000E0DFEDD|nr:hypothetical protein [Rhizobium phaseoli]RDJ18213.1 hypothetical protein B5K04_00475 [Rhizobium phaseoli]RDJ19305.1 hypothetical protein B5K05_00480 [Rhizobium phaseoli]